MSDVRYLRQIKKLLEDKLADTVLFNGEQYKPYPSQMIFHNLKVQQRLISAGNQLGKTAAGAYETACHLTGLYPEWWDGLRYDRPIRCWIGGLSGTLIRDGSQRKLIGDPEGTGMIPKQRLIKTTPARGVSGLKDSGFVRWRDSKTEFSSFIFKSYEQGASKWQTETVDFIWIDEECPEDVFAECMARISAANGNLIMTFTPLLGMTQVVRTFFAGMPDQWHGKYFTPATSRNRAVVMMSINEIGHMSAEQKLKVAENYPEHERDARLHGIPKLGSGAIYPIEESKIRIEPFEIPSHWKRLIGIDFGIDHPTALVWGAHDSEQDILYIYDCWRQSANSLGSGVDLVAIAADVVKSRNPGIPVAYPHDGDNREKGTGQTLADLYRRKGVAMRSDHARFEDGTWKVEPGISRIWSRMASGRMKVFAHLDQWFSEFRGYHRNNGAIVKEYDDLMDATRYLEMDLRHARSLKLIESVKKDVYSSQARQPRSWKTA